MRGVSSACSTTERRGVPIPAPPPLLSSPLNFELLLSQKIDFVRVAFRVSAVQRLHAALQAADLRG